LPLGRALVIVIMLLVAIFLVVTSRLFLWPPSDRPSRADAVVALGGDPGQQRAKAAVQLARSGYAPIVVVSLGGGGARCPAAHPTMRIICFRADPLDTRGEAEYVARLVRRHHWRKIIVVPERSQTTRARLLFERCTGASLEMVPVADPGSRLLVDVAYEWGALLKALVWKTSC